MVLNRKKKYLLHPFHGQLILSMKHEMENALTPVGQTLSIIKNKNLS